jgi:hypothetical protein
VIPHRTGTAGEPRLVLHVGASKCGSSALQVAMSHAETLGAHGPGTSVYAAIHQREGLLHGARLRDQARRNVSNYVASAPAHVIAEQGWIWRRRIAREIAALVRSHGQVVLSNEGWFHRFDALGAAGLFQRVGVPVAVHAYVRPQVPFMNSAWWQWGAWTGTPLEHWVGKRLPSVQWHRFVERLQAADWVERVEVRALPRDVVADFAATLDLEALGAQSALGTASGGARAAPVNRGMPGEILRIVQRHPELWPVMSNSNLGFALGRHLEGREPTPWVLDRKLERRILDACLDSNRRLCALVSVEQAAVIRADPAWWRLPEERGRAAEPWQAMPPRVRTLDRLCAEMAKVILALDREQRRGRRQG